jgi:hypothetical protein
MCRPAVDACWSTWFGRSIWAPPSGDVRQWGDWNDLACLSTSGDPCLTEDPTSIQSYGHSYSSLIHSTSATMQLAAQIYLSTSESTAYAIEQMDELTDRQGCFYVHFSCMRLLQLFDIQKFRECFRLWASVQLFPGKLQQLGSEHASTHECYLDVCYI